MNLSSLQDIMQFHKSPWNHCMLSELSCCVPTSASATKTCSRVVCDIEYSSTPSSARAASILANRDGRSKSCNPTTTPVKCFQESHKNPTSLHTPQHEPRTPNALSSKLSQNHSHPVPMHAKVLEETFIFRNAPSELSAAQFENMHIPMGPHPFHSNSLSAHLQQTRQPVTYWGMLKHNSLFSPH